MSVICQNFVQNAWKKDLCSNCFKSLGDHESQEPTTVLHTCLDESHQRNGITPQTGTRYISQATTIYQSRGILNHATWTSLITDRQDKKNGYFQLENGFQGKLLTISTTTSNGVEKNPDVTLPKTNGCNQPIITNGCTQTANINGYEKKPLANGHTNGHTNGHHVVSNGTKNSVFPLSILKDESIIKPSSNVRFNEELHLVIGYGGNDYDSDDQDWETGSDDEDFPIESLDSSAEDRAITKTTRENTEFNSDNANLLRGIDLTKTVKKNKNVSNGILPNGSTKETNEKNGRDVKPPPQEKDKNITGEATENVKNDDTWETENSGRKCTSLFNGVHHASSLSNGRRRDQAPPQASVKPFIRETPSSIESKEKVKEDNRLADAPNGSTDSKSLPEIIEKAPIKSDLIKNQEALSPAVANTNNHKSKDEQQKVSSNLKIEDSKPTVVNDCTLATLGKEVVTTTESSIKSTNQTMSSGSRENKLISQSIAHARRSFLHGTAAEPEIDEGTESAIYTPGKVDLFVVNGSSTSSLDTTSDSDSSSSSNGIKIPNESVPPSNTSDEGVKAETTSSPLFAAVLAEPVALTPEEGRVTTTTVCEPHLPKGNLKSKGATKIDNPNYKVLGNEVQSDCLSSPDSSQRSVTFASQAGSEPIYPHSRRSSGGSSSKESSPTNSRSSFSSGEQPIYYAVSNTIIHTENIASVPHVATVRRTPVCHYAESNIFPEADRRSSSSEKPSKNVREHKLAALAQELEQARLSGNGSKRPAPSPPKTMEPLELRSPSLSASQSTPSTPTPLVTNFHKPSEIEESQYGCINVYGKTSGNGHTNGTPKGKSATISAVHGKKVLALLNFDETVKSPKKSGKFSIKKFLKRGKDMESLDHIFQQQQACSPTTPNQKAWKNTEFDRSKLKLQIIHPMDMPHKDGVSMQSTNEIINVSKPYGISPASTPEKTQYQTFPYQDTPPHGLLHGSTDGIYDDESTWMAYSDGNASEKACSNYESSNIEKPMASPMLSTFSQTGSTTLCVSSTQPLTPNANHDLYQTAMTKSSVKTVRPPKPPPPPRLRSLTPGSHEMLYDERHSSSSPNVPATLPPKPQVPKRLFRPSMKSDYANLGDVRTPVAPKKPDRFSNSRPSTPGCLESPSNMYYDDENAYELVGVECETHYLSTSEQTDDGEPIYYDGSSVCAYDLYSKKSQTNSQNSSQEIMNYNQDKVQDQRGTFSDKPGEQPNRPPNGRCGEKIQPLAWLSLEQSYTIVAAANHEVLAKLIDQIISKKATVFQKPDGRSVTWEDFDLQPGQAVSSVGEKSVYNAVFRHSPKKEVTLLVTIQQSTLPNRDSPSKNVFLGFFTDILPRSTVISGWSNQGADMIQAQVYILPKSEVMSIRSKFHGRMLPTDRNEVSFFEKEFCFVYLQLIHALKILQAHGTEEIDLSHEDLILSKDEKENMSNLVFLPGDLVNQDQQSSAEKASLCQYALGFMLQALNISDFNMLCSENVNNPLSNASQKIFITVAKVLTQEKASSLSKAKNLLEFHLWGPKETVYQKMPAGKGMEETLQRWLDIERAHNLRILVRSLQSISATDEHKLQFLVRTSAKVLRDLTSTLSFEKL